MKTKRILVAILMFAIVPITLHFTLVALAMCVHNHFVLMVLKLMIKKAIYMIALRVKSLLDNSNIGNY